MFAVGEGRMPVRTNYELPTTNHIKAGHKLVGDFQPGERAIVRLQFRLECERLAGVSVVFGHELTIFKVAVDFRSQRQNDAG